MNLPPSNEGRNAGTFNRFSTAISEPFIDLENNIDYEVLRDSAISRHITVRMGTVTNEWTSGSRKNIVLEEGVGSLITRDGDSLTIAALNTGQAHSLDPGTTYYYRAHPDDRCIIHEVDIPNSPID